MALRFRRGTTDQFDILGMPGEKRRFAAGEPVWDTEAGILYIGQGTLDTDSLPIALVAGTTAVESEGSIVQTIVNNITYEGDNIYAGDNVYTGVQSSTPVPTTSTELGNGIDLDDGNLFIVESDAIGVMLGNPVNGTVGQAGAIIFTATTTNIMYAYGANWLFPGARPTEFQGAGRIDYVVSTVGATGTIVQARITSNLV